MHEERRAIFLGLMGKRRSYEEDYGYWCWKSSFVEEEIPQAQQGPIGVLVGDDCGVVGNVQFKIVLSKPPGTFGGMLQEMVHQNQQM